MEATLQALGRILLNSLPTFILVILLHFYLKYMFFRPLDRVLHKRYELTEGAKKLADESLQKATDKAKEYEAALRAARAEIYQAQEQLHQRLQEEREAEMQAARSQSEDTIQQAKTELANDVARAKETLAEESAVLADQIAETVLRRWVA